MKLSYFRKSTFSLVETAKNVKENLVKSGFIVLSETPLFHENGVLITFINEDRLNELVGEEPSIFNLLPSSFLVVKDDDEVELGIGSAGILSGVTENEAVHALSKDYENVLKDVLHSSAGVSDLKPTNVRLFSTKSCPYCTMEKEWLEKNNVAHEVIYVDSNQKEAQYMVEKTGQMGVPVTEIVYEDADSEFIVGFDTVRLSSTIGL